MIPTRHQNVQTTLNHHAPSTKHHAPSTTHPPRSTIHHQASICHLHHPPSIIREQALANRLALAQLTVPVATGWLELINTTSHTWIWAFMPIRISSRQQKCPKDPEPPLGKTLKTNSTSKQNEVRQTKQSSICRSANNSS